MHKFLFKLKVLLASQKSKKFWKRSQIPSSKYTLQYRNDFIVNKIASIMKTLKIKVQVEGYENLGTNGPCLLYGNHQDNFDALALMYALKAQTEAKDDFNKISTFIAKHTLQYKSYTRNPLTCINTFFLDRDNIKKSLDTFDQFGKFIKENKTYGVIFPEGTRNREGTVGEFKAGSFKVAKKELIPIIPFTINNSVGAFDSNRNEQLIIKVIFHKKMTAHSFATQNTIGLAERVQKIVANSFVKPQYQFKDDKETKNIEESKSAKKWWKKQEKIKQKADKKEQKKLKMEQKIENQQKKQDEKYEKQLQKNKKNN